MRLYEIQRDHYQLLKRVSDPHLTDEERLSAEQALATTQQELSDKLENCVKYYKNLDGDIEQLEREIKRLQETKRVKQARQDWFKRYIAACFPNGKWNRDLHAISYRLSKTVEVPDCDKLPDQYCRIKTIREPDKTLIKEVIECGGEVPGATLVEKQNIQIR